MSKTTYIVLRNIEKKVFNSIAFMVTIATLFCIIFGGSILSESLQIGAKNTVKRLGADLMIIPSSSSEIAEDILLTGSREYFYMDKAIFDVILSVKGVNEATYQFYLASLVQSCCTSGDVSIVGFDLETDFMIQPWIAENYMGDIANGEAVIGSEIVLEDDGTIQLFETKYNVAVRLAKTGTAIDTSVYFTKDILPQMVEDAQKKSYGFFDDQKDIQSISTVFVNLEDGQSQTEIVKSIKEATTEKIEVVYPKGIANSISKSMLGFMKGLMILMGVIVFISVLILFIINMMVSNRRRREFALLRTVGATVRDILWMLAKEVILLTLIGGLLGGILSIVITLLFGRYIGSIVNMPYLCPSADIIAFIFMKTLFVSVIVGIVASAYPVIRVCKEESYTALKEEE